MPEWPNLNVGITVPCFEYIVNFQTCSFLSQKPQRKLGRDAKILIGLCSVHVILPGNSSYIHLYNLLFFCEYAVSVAHRFEMMHGYLKCFPVEAYRPRSNIVMAVQMGTASVIGYWVISPSVPRCLRIAMIWRTGSLSPQYGAHGLTVSWSSKGLSWIQLSPWLCSGNRLTNTLFIDRPFLYSNSLMPRHWLDDIILAVTQ